MKNRTHFKPMIALAAMLWCGQIAPVLLAQEPAPAAATQTAPVQLSAGVGDVLKLAQAKVSDGIITSYIKNSGKVYSLSPSEILYLREQGLSDQVVTAMLDQRKSVAATVAQAAPPPTATAQASVSASSTTSISSQNPPAATQPAATQPAATQPAATQPAVTYVQAPLVYAEPSPVYVYPAGYGYGGYWGYPAVSFSFGYWGGHYGGYHGGGYHGGGYHGGGSHGGGGHR